jgi:cyclase
MQRLSEHLYAETKYDWANVGAAVTDEGVVLLDTPVRPTDSKHWQGEIQGLSPKGIRFLIATDYHGDHTTGSSFIESDVIFVAPQYVYEEVAKGDNAFSKEIFVETLRDLGHTNEADAIEMGQVPLPHLCFEDNLILHLLPLTLEIYRKGGHSPACTSVFIPEESVLFSGDVVINGPSAGLRDAHIGEWIEALSWVESLDLEKIVPGHGEICGKEVAVNLRELLSDIRGTMEVQLDLGRTKEEAVEDDSFQKFFYADTTRGEYWLQQRKDTFRDGLARVFDEIVEERKNL